MKLLQEAFNQLAETVETQISIATAPAQTPAPTNVQSDAPDIVKAFAEALQPIQQQLGLLTAQMTEMKKAPATQPTVPTRISLDPKLVQQRSTVVKSETPSLRKLVEATT